MSLADSRTVVANGTIASQAPVAPRSTDTRGADIVRWIGFVIVGFTITLLRPSDPTQRFTFGHEDGTVFTPQVRHLGIWRSLRTTYEYLHLLPRLVGAVASALP